MASNLSESEEKTFAALVLIQLAQTVRESLIPDSQGQFMVIIYFDITFLN